MDVLMVEVIQSTLMAAHCRGGTERELSSAGRITSTSLGVLHQHMLLGPSPDAKHINLPSYNHDNFSLVGWTQA